MRYDADQRSLAERAGISRTTVGACQRELVASGWLIPLRRSTRRTDAQRWKLNIAKVGPHTPQPACVFRGECGPDLTAPIAPDAARWGALGATGMAVYEALLAAKSTIAEVATAATCSTATARRHLRRLEQVSLGRRAGDGRWYAVERDWAAVARDLQSEGRGQKQHTKHQDERRQHAAMLTGVDAVHAARDERVIARSLDGLTGFERYNWMKERHGAQARQRRRACARAVKVVDQSCTEGAVRGDVRSMDVDGAPMLVDTTTGEMAPLPRTASPNRRRRRASKASDPQPRNYLAPSRGGEHPATDGRS
jgi:hypothetical protein